METSHLKYGVVSILIAFVIGIVAYKAYEHRTVSSFINLTNQQTIDDIAHIEKILLLADEIDQQDSNQQEELDETAPTEVDIDNIRKNIDAYINDTRLISDNLESYEKRTVDNVEAIASFQKNHPLLPGKPKTMISAYIQNQTEFYTDEQKDIHSGIVLMNIVERNLIFTQDGLLLGEFLSTTDVLDQDEVSENITSLSGFARYSADDYEASSEEIKEYSKEADKILNETADYLGDFYDAAKELAAGDLDSAGYKLNRLGEREADLNSLALDELQELRRDTNIDLKTNLVDALIEKLALQKNYPSNSFTFPGLGSAPSWEHELSVCYLYYYKNDLYSVKQKGYPVSSTKEELVSELDKVSPDLSAWNTTFVESSSISLEVVKTDEDNYRKLTCSDLSGTEYVLTYTPSEEE